MVSSVMNARFMRERSGHTVRLTQARFEQCFVQIDGGAREGPFYQIVGEQLFSNGTHARVRVLKKPFELLAALASNHALVGQAAIQIAKCLTIFKLFASEFGTVAAEMPGVIAARELFIGPMPAARPAVVALPSAVSFPFLVGHGRIRSHVNYAIEGFVGWPVRCQH